MTTYNLRILSEIRSTESYMRKYNLSGWIDLPEDFYETHDLNYVKCVKIHLNIGKSGSLRYSKSEIDKVMDDNNHKIVCGQTLEMVHKLFIEYAKIGIVCLIGEDDEN